MCDDDKLPDVSVDVARVRYTQCSSCSGKARGVTRDIVAEIHEVAVSTKYVDNWPHRRNDINRLSTSFRYKIRLLVKLRNLDDTGCGRKLRSWRRNFNVKKTIVKATNFYNA